jgi:signal transduction histidine kinase
VLIETEFLHLVLPQKKSEREGKGFGLFIAREVTKYHEGNLYLDISEDTDGRLRTFILELPN